MRFVRSRFHMSQMIAPGRTSARSAPSVSVVEGGVVHRQEHDVGVAQRLLARFVRQQRIVQVHIRAFGQEDLLQLERQRVADVVDVALERQPEDGDARAVELAAARAHLLDEPGGRRLVDLPGAGDQLVVGNAAGEEEAVLVQAGAAGEAGRLQAAALVVAVDGVDDRVDLAPVLRRDHHELVADGEVDVAVHVAEELRELGAARVDRNDGRGHLRKEPRGAIAARVVHAADDLRHLGQLGEGFSLGDALGAEREVEVAPDAQVGGALDEPAEMLGRARRDGAAQHQELPLCAGAACAARSRFSIGWKIGLLKSSTGVPRVMMMTSALASAARSRAGEEPRPAGRRERLGGAVLAKRQAPGGEALHRRRVVVDAVDGASALRQEQREREPDAPEPDDGDRVLHRAHAFPMTSRSPVAKSISGSQPSSRFALLPSGTRRFTSEGKPGTNVAANGLSPPQAS